jgi:light-harvesting complex I chlorophyll a/b binding protein 4
MLSVSGKKSSSQVATEFVTQMPGILSPTGFWDPAGLAKMKTPEQLMYTREAELKHGRVAMLAALGFPFAEEFHPIFPGDGVPSDFSFQLTPLQTYWPLVLLAVGALELPAIRTFKDLGNGVWELKDDHVSGDLGYDPLGLKPEDPDKLLTMQNRELNNGRLAMIGIAGMVAQELVTRTDVLDADVADFYADVAIAAKDVQAIESLAGVSMF